MNRTVTKNRLVRYDSSCRPTNEQVDQKEMKSFSNLHFDFFVVLFLAVVDIFSIFDVDSLRLMHDVAYSVLRFESVL